jgi:uncharacterized iron-regulated protein
MNVFSIVPMIRILAMLAGLAGLPLSAHALPAAALPASIIGSDVILKGADGQTVSKASLVAAMRAADIVILGEVHENPEHHRLRGELIAAIARPGLTILAEHLDAGKRADFSKGVLAGLQAAGFDAKAWQWPMHEPLFNAAAGSGLAVWGANLPANMTGKVHASGWSVLPQDIRDRLARAALTEAARSALEQELFDGHCKMLPREMLPKMLGVQRARDGYMAHETLARLPAVLLAGNGHAWRLAGVPQVIAANAPQARMVSVMFVEGRPKDLSAADYFWVTAEVIRPDPCEQFRRR